jgi:hypothetical protein
MGLERLSLRKNLRKIAGLPSLGVIALNDVTASAANYCLW